MPNQLYSDLSPQDKDMIFDIAKGVSFKITGFQGFDKAQVTAGGVDTAMINSDTLESKLYKDIYFVGEVLDVDGNCGGYNLQFAFASANRCVDAIIKEFNDDTN
jgi:predicted flavoprotein YhiN